jgi:hypothetical protein
VRSASLRRARSSRCRCAVLVTMPTAAAASDVRAARFYHEIPDELVADGGHAEAGDSGDDCPAPWLVCADGFESKPRPAGATTGGVFKIPRRGCGISTKRLSREQLKYIVTTLTDITRVIHEADPRDKAEIYSQLGLRLTYQPGKAAVLVEARLAPASVCVRFVSEGDLNPDSPH